jgi:hypothetical protein
VRATERDDARRHLLREHPAHLTRDSRHHRDPFLLVVLEPDSGRGAVAIGKQRGAFRQHRLVAVRRGQLAEAESCPPFHDRIKRRLVKHDVAAEERGNGVP